MAYFMSAAIKINQKPCRLAGIGARHMSALTIYFILYSHHMVTDDNYTSLSLSHPYECVDISEHCGTLHSPTCTELFRYMFVAISMFLG